MLHPSSPPPWKVLTSRATSRTTLRAAITAPGPTPHSNRVDGARDVGTGRRTERTTFRPVRIAGYIPRTVTRAPKGWNGRPVAPVRRFRSSDAPPVTPSSGGVPRPRAATTTGGAERLDSSAVPLVKHDQFSRASAGRLDTHRQDRYREISESALPERSRHWTELTERGDIPRCGEHGTSANRAGGQPRTREPGSLVG